MKYRFIEENRPMAPLRVFCRALGVTKAGFLAWRHRPECPRRSQDRQVAERIRRIHQNSGSAYGSPRIHQELRAQDLRVSRKREKINVNLALLSFRDK